MAHFDDYIGPVVDYIAHELLHRKETDLVELLRIADVGTEKDEESILAGWAFRLRFFLPQAAYRRIREERSAAERTLLEIGREAMTMHEWIHLTGVEILPKVTSDPSWRLGLEQPVRVTDEESNRIWKPGYFRLFLSHKSTIRKELHELKAPLLRHGIDCFIAHDDVEPNRAWQTEIEHGLQTCDALAAFHSPGFQQSVWCMQEIGWALGRGIFVQSLLVGEAPYGFHGHAQGMAIDFSKPIEAAAKIALTLRKEDRLEAKTFDGIAQQFAAVESGSDTWYTWGCFEKLWPCPDSHREKIAQAFKGNEEAMKSTHAVPALRKWLGEDKPKIRKDAFVPSVDDFDPFAEE